MSDRDHSDDLRPDRAALDELLRAFGLEADAEADAAVTGESERPAADDPIDDDPIDDDPIDDDPIDDDPIDVLIVEQEPVADPSPPTIIRIDDYSGSVVIKPAEPADPVDLGGATEPAGLPDPAEGVDGNPPGGDEPVASVITIADGDLPDAVYVEGNLDRGGNRAIVFIEDDDTGDALAPESERDVRRGIEPRMRERRIAVKRALGRKRLRWVIGVTSLVVVVVGVLAVLGSDLFAIQRDKVSLIGAVYADPAQVEAIVDGVVGTPALLVDSQDVERRLEAIPWVDTAKVTVDFPHAVTIDIREREAISIYRGPDLRFRVLDREGRVLDVREMQPIAYALIQGPDPVDLEPGEFAPRGYVAASELARTLTGSVRPLLSYIEVTADGSNLDLHLSDGTRVRFGQATDLFDKLVRLETVLTANPDREPGLIDVSTSEVTL